MNLIKVSLRNAKGHDCPDIKVGRKFKYLAVFVDGEMVVGSFEYQWYGLNFNACYDAGFQFDQPGTNQSRWKELYKIEQKLNKKCNKVVAWKQKNKLKTHSRESLIT